MLLIRFVSKLTCSKDEDAFDNMQLVVHGLGAKSGGATFDFTLRGSTASHAHPFDVVPYPLPGLGEHRITKVACGLAHVVLLAASGVVLTFGDNANGALGVSGDLKNAACATVDIPSGGVVCIAAGPASTCAINAEGKLYLWGKVGSSKGLFVHKCVRFGDCFLTMIF
jgi:hypothetical protein